jgi:hypothetical protein
MAQTRRIASPSDIALNTFPLMNDQSSTRQISLFDPYSQESKLYNQAISTTLMNYLVQYDMVEPYGRATPNRKGITINADIEEPTKLFKAGVVVNMLSEVVSEGDSVTLEKRKFTKVQGGFVFNVNQLIDFKKLIAINGGIRTESSVRGGTNPVNLSSNLIDLGLDVEVLKDLHLLGGAKIFSVKGSEVQTGRDALNQITSFGPSSTYNQTQNIIVTGLRYNYDDAGYFSMQYNIVDFKNKETPINNFNLNQWFFVFGLKF